LIPIKPIQIIEDIQTDADVNLNYYEANDAFGDDESEEGIWNEAEGMVDEEIDVYKICVIYLTYDNLAMHKLNLRIKRYKML
jgi:hypothetical protein